MQNVPDVEYPVSRIEAGESDDPIFLALVALWNGDRLPVPPEPLEDILRRTRPAFFLEEAGSA